ncbi:MAG TPA: hypothetical protein PK987_00865 [Ferruginibacter sp.]|nr:hypothetical protein [Ferruginibacter sp.]
MDNKDYILNELKEISTLVASIKRVNVFTVPDGYFSFLPADILVGIKAENGLDAEVLSTTESTLPTGYFDSLAGKIMQKINAVHTETATEEIRALSPMLYSLQNENVFDIPAGYFNHSTSEIVEKVRPKAKLVRLKHSSTFFKYAVAAVFTGAMAMAVFKFTGTSNNKILPNYVQAGMQINDVDGALSKISDADILKYLEETGTDVKAAIVANSIDENELPSQDDYLQDEKALDKYLNSINLDDLKN